MSSRIILDENQSSLGALEGLKLLVLFYNAVKIMHLVINCTAENRTELHDRLKTL